MPTTKGLKSNMEETPMMTRKNIVGMLAATAIAFSYALLPNTAAAEIVKLELWARQDTSGPLRAGNVVAAVDRLNAALAAEGSDTVVELMVNESPAAGFDDDALQLLRAFGIGKGPDLFVAAHEWICTFAEEGFAYDLTDMIVANPDQFGDIFENLWGSTECKGARFAVPQDAEARMFFYNKNLLREAGFDDVFIESMPDRVLAGEIVLDDLSAIAKQVIDNTSAEYGILHRPSRGPDYIMVFNTYGSSFFDEASGQLLLEPAKIEAGYAWFERNVKSGVTPANNTSMEWGAIRDNFYKDNNAAFWMYGIWDLGSEAFPRGVPSEKEAFFADWGWVAAPPAEAGGSPSSLTHPIVYAVSAVSENKDLAARLIGFASDADLNTDHAVTTTHLGIKKSQLDDPRYQAAWPLMEATPFLEFTKFIPNNPDFGALNAIIYQGLQGVEQGRLTASEAAAFVVEEAQSQIDGVLVQ
jgi:inositol-phosphate transport system substrate-binding protein